MKTNETLTRYIKNWADSAEIELCNSHLTLCFLTSFSLRNAQLFIYRFRWRAFKTFQWINESKYLH